jgi:hypothetical protein
LAAIRLGNHTRHILETQSENALPVGFAE